MQKYYRMKEVSSTEERMSKGIYEKDGKHYVLSWGHDISTLAADGVTILHNTEIEGVIAADDDEDAAKQFGLTRYIPQ